MITYICFIFGFICCLFTFHGPMNRLLIKILSKKEFSKKQMNLTSFIKDRVQDYGNNRPTQICIFFEYPSSYTQKDDKKIVKKAYDLCLKNQNLRTICNINYLYALDIKDKNMIFGTFYGLSDKKPNIKSYSIFLEEI